MKVVLPFIYLFIYAELSCKSILVVENSPSRLKNNTSLAYSLPITFLHYSHLPLLCKTGHILLCSKLDLPQYEIKQHRSHTEYFA